MVEGKCPRCGSQYHGWVLLNQRGQVCSRCGVALEITEDGQTYTGYSPFTAEEHRIELPEGSGTRTEDHSKEDISDKK